MNASTFRNSASGLTLVELAVTILILGLLAAAVLPRFADSQVQAHEGSVRAVGTAFATAVQLVHAQWRVNGAIPDANRVPGFGGADISMNADGWPTGIDGRDVILTGNRGRAQCGDLLSTLLLNDPNFAPTETDQNLFISSAHVFGSSPSHDPAADYRVSAPALNQCSFEYRPIGNLGFTYDGTTGAVLIDDDAGS